MSEPRRSLLASLRSALQVLATSWHTLRHARRGTLDQPTVDALARDMGQRIMGIARVRLRVEGVEALDPRAGYLFMSNHESLMDIPLIFATASAPPRMVTKAELFRVPIWGHALATADFIPVNRRDRKQAIASLARARELMERGICVWMAPEGTRSKDGTLLPFKKGGFMLALETGATIVPVGIEGARNIVEPHRLRLSLDQEVVVRYGQPIDTREYTLEQRDELMARVREAIAALRAPRDSQDGPSRP